MSRTRNPPNEPGALFVDVVVEIPKWSFVKYGSTGRVDFISPLPCPVNYGSVPDYLGLEGDLLDAVVLGPRLARGTHLRIPAWGAVTLADRGLIDDKLICSLRPVTAAQRAALLRFFRVYARCKALLNLSRGRRGRNACDGWCNVSQALARARPRGTGWRGSPVDF